MIKLLSIVAIVLSLSLSQCCMAQAEPDWMSKVRKDAEVSPQPVPETESGSKPGPMPPSVMPPSPLDEMLDRMEAAIRDASNAASKANDAAERAETAAKQYSSAMKSTGDWQSDVDRISKLEDAVRELQSRKQWSEDEIRVIAKDEAEKLIKATVKNSKGEVREVGADSIEVSVSGYSGTFSLKPGEQIVSIDGKPITGRASMVSNGVKTSMAVTEDLQLQTVPQRSGVVRFWSLPSRAAGRVASGASGTCRNVFNAATGRWERQCN